MLTLLEDKTVLGIRVFFGGGAGDEAKMYRRLTVTENKVGRLWKLLFHDHEMNKVLSRDTHHIRQPD